MNRKDLLQMCFYVREILFRGKRLQGGNWVYGYFFKSDINKRERESGKATLIFTPDCDTFIMVPECHNSFMVVSDTVGQYTGLNDKNGKKIFEGDIVKSIETKETGVVQFFPEHSAFMVWCKFSNEVGFLYECTSIAEVIGNIHDNPELLEDA